MSKHTPKKTTLKVEIGGRQFITHGVSAQIWHDAYHYAMTSSWPLFFGVFAGLFVSLNFLFAVLYSFDPGSIANQFPKGFWGGFFFSVETLATVGYGDMHPQTVYGHIVSTIEIFIGMSGIAMITGVMFARFSRPKAKILFTRHPVTYRHNGEQVMSIRIANTRMNIIAEASAKLRMLVVEQTVEDTRFTRIVDLPLKRDQHPMFSLGWNLFHVIDHDSPFFNKSINDLEKLQMRLILSVDGIDETTSQNLRARHIYSWQDLRFNHRYRDISSYDDQMNSHLDFSLFHEIEAEQLAQEGL
jgi:inward rectifier potassium channel